MNLPKRIKTISLVLAFAAIAAPVGAQKATEQFIPIGKSPGASYKYSYYGKIVAVDSDEHAITVEDEAGRHVMRVLPSTRIWLDRSKRQRRNTPGTFEDCEIGRRVEIMHLRDDSRTAAWIKIEAL